MRRVNYSSILGNARVFNGAQLIVRSIVVWDRLATYLGDWADGMSHMAMHLCDHLRHLMGLAPSKRRGLCPVAASATPTVTARVTRTQWRPETQS
ncbi:MAG: hypothetical protein KDA61_05115 [Planctomycetales bacterium]|nr:hypothetical protein [Planctomycetales bacterium]